MNQQECMPPESIDDNLEHVLVEWLQRLQAREITEEEARAVLHGMKGRLEFLRDLRSRIDEHGEFAEQARHVEQEIGRQIEEIETVQRSLTSASEEKEFG